MAGQLFITSQNKTMSRLLICLCLNVHVVGNGDVSDVGILISSRFSWKGDNLLNWVRVACGHLLAA